ncbi:tetratricopeptide repeat protein [bacterium]|nr:tetratricopeptide repeat protein [bacterium]
MRIKNQWRGFIVVAVVTLFICGQLGCGGGNSNSDDGDLNLADSLTDDTKFVEDAPSAGAIAELQQSLLAEYEVKVNCNIHTELAPKGLLGIKVLSDPPADAQEYLSLGAVAFTAGDLETAAWCYLSAFALAPDNPYVLSNIGFILNYLERHIEARLFLLYGYSIDDTLHTLLSNLGYSYESLGNYERAVYYYNKALMRYPSIAYLKFLLGRAFLGAKQYVLAGQFLTDAERILPNDADIQTALATLAEEESSSDDPTPSIDPWSEGTDSNDGEKMMTEWMECYQQKILDERSSAAPPYIVLGATIDQSEWETDSRFYVSGQKTPDCVTACGQPINDLCEAMCYDAWCSRDTGILADGSRKLENEYSNYYGAIGGLLDGYAACAFDVYYRYKNVKPSMFPKYVYDGTWSNIESAEEGRRDVGNGVEETISSWNDYVASTCDGIPGMFEAIDWESVINPPTNDINLCTMEVMGTKVCFKSDGNTVTATGTVGPYSFTVSGTPFQPFQVTYGRVLYLHNGAEVSVMMKYNARQASPDVVLNGTVTSKVPNASYSKDIALYSNN